MIVNRLFLLSDIFLTAFLAMLMTLTPVPGLANDAGTVADQLGSTEAATRAKGIALLQEQGQCLMPGLADILRTGPTPARRGAAIGLALMPVPALSVDGLILGLGDEDAVVRSLCAHGLGKIGAPAAQQAARLLTHSDNRVRVGAALALSRMGTEAVPALITMLELNDPAVTGKTAWLLGTMGRDALPAVPALIRALETDDMRVLHVLAATIDAIGPDPSTVYHELTMLGSDRTFCPASRVGGDAAPTLVKLLARPGTRMATIAFYSLARMGPVAKPALTLAQATGNDSQKAAAALLLSNIDPNPAHPQPGDTRGSETGATHKQ